MPLQHVEWIDRPAWWGPWGWLMPVLMLVLVAVAAVWAIARVSRDRPAAERSQPSTSPGVPGGAPTPDPALERARVRYAGGEISREEYLRLAADLGAPVGVASADG